MLRKYIIFEILTFVFCHDFQNNDGIHDCSKIKILLSFNNENIIRCLATVAKTGTSYCRGCETELNLKIDKSPEMHAACKYFQLPQSTAFDIKDVGHGHILVVDSGKCLNCSQKKASWFSSKSDMLEIHHISELQRDLFNAQQRVQECVDFFVDDLLEMPSECRDKMDNYRNIFKEHGKYHESCSGFVATMSKLEREWLQLSNNATVLAKAFPHRDNEWSHASYILLAALITFLLAAVGFVLIKYYFPRQDKPVNTNP